MDELLIAIQNVANTIATPNWADKLSVLLSLLAIFAAGIVAWRQNKISREQTEISRKQTDIADKQNKIALFEKRYAVYHEIANIISVGETLDSRQMPARDELLVILEVSWDISFTDWQDTQAIAATILKKLTEAKHIIAQTIFLFPQVSKKDVDDLLSATADFMGLALLNGEIDFKSVSLKKLVNTSMDFKKKYLDMIVRELDLTGGV